MRRYADQMGITADVIEQVAREALDDATATIAHWSVQPLGGGSSEEFAAGGISRVSCSVATKHGVTDWSTIVKVIQTASAGFGDVTFVLDDPQGWDYARREPDAYRSGLLEDLGSGLVAPRCYRVDEDASEIMLWLEDLPDEGPSTWSLERYRLAARHLGRFNGLYLESRELPSYPWLSRGRVRDWLRVGEPGIRAMREGRRPGLLSTWLSDKTVDRIEHLWHERSRLVDALEGLPETLCHHDAQRRNLGSRQVGGVEQTIAIDWQMVGIGRPGEELAPFIAVPLQYLDVPVDDVGAFESVAFAGYFDGLRDAGWDGDEEQVRLGFLIGASVFMGVGGAGLWFSFISTDDGAPERVIGRSTDEIAAQWSVLQSYLLDLGDEALSTIS